MPGRTCRRARKAGTVRSMRRTSSGRSGRGPTRLISPRSTLTICGSSSRCSRRSTRPTRVVRASRHAARIGPVRLSAPVDHGAELQDAEHAPAASEPRLPVQHRPGAFEPDRHRDRHAQHNPQRKKKEQGGGDRREVERALVVPAIGRTRLPRRRLPCGVALPPGPAFYAPYTRGGRAAAHAEAGSREPGPPGPLPLRVAASRPASDAGRPGSLTIRLCIVPPSVMQHTGAVLPPCRADVARAPSQARKVKRLAFLRTSLR